MRLTNHTDIPSETVRAIIRAVRPAGIGNFDVRISNTSRHACGRAYTEGSGYHDTASPFLVVRVAKTDRAAQTRNTKPDGAYLPHVWGSRIEALLWVVAHELRHMWQARGTSLDNRRRVVRPRRGMVYGSRGRFSERDADAYAMQMLRRFRRGELALGNVTSPTRPDLDY
ncbi:MAG TPA: hypothetical protein VK571_00965 [Gemmatimonadaceae bacterium]|nr:hypothetical protein [Gemmatimonadaceae bacterium]